MPIGSYFIVYSTTQTINDAEVQQKYFKDNYQISAVRVEIEDNGTQQ
jgi:type VI secretion system protein ImpK